MIGACWFSPWYPLTPTDRVFAAPHRDSGPCDRRSTEEAHDHLETINSNRKPLEADSSCATCPWLVAILLFVYRICCSFYGRFGRGVFCGGGGLFFCFIFGGFLPYWWRSAASILLWQYAILHKHFWLLLMGSAVSIPGSLCALLIQASSFSNQIMESKFLRLLRLGGSRRWGRVDVEGNRCLIKARNVYDENKLHNVLFSSKRLLKSLCQETSTDVEGFWFFDFSIVFYILV